ncbi:bactofilin family protein [Helicobacter japonicus]|uniref:Polymer-forming cytoskeletal family protein n=1 Tax=Helicobacter japonicus TaxID=425400 RepID=A0A4U8TRA0_9HELI|nr:polymer-forming cytoskeletal protein [Helicobacter japonicus]MDE7235408.1 polymer-forming cytoskeletal protein [Helicobacter japonicus]TLE03220.1 polymer-forming cytoskeletal family protein [Helicobacter japonicus]
MAIFVSDNKQSDGVSSSGGATIIAQGTRIKGEINADCRLHIDGEFEGTIHSKDTVMVGKNGIVRGDIESASLIVSGRFIGNITANVLEIKPQGRVEGTAATSEFVIERKGMFIGESKIKSPKTNKIEVISSELPKK